MAQAKAGSAVRPIGKIEIVPGIWYDLCRGTKAEMTEHEGWCDFNARRIAIRCDLHGQAYQTAKAHEVMHALFHETPLSAWLAQVAKLKGDALDAAEETLVQILSTTVPHAFGSAGLLRRRKA